MVIPSAGYGAASRTVSLVWGYASHWVSFFFCLYALGPTGTGATRVDQPGVDCVGRLIRTRGALRAIAPVTWAATHGVSSARLSLLTGNRCLWLIMGTAPTRGCDQRVGRGGSNHQAAANGQAGNTKAARAHAEPRSGGPTKQTRHSANAQGTRGRKPEMARDNGGAQRT